MKPASYLHRAKRTLAEDLIHYRRENEALKRSIESGIRLTVQYRQEIQRLKALPSLERLVIDAILYDRAGERSCSDCEQCSKFVACAFHSVLAVLDGCCSIPDAHGNRLRLPEAKCQSQP